MNIIFFFTVLITILYILEILAFFNKKQTLLLDNKWVILLVTFMISGLWTIIYNYRTPAIITYELATISSHICIDSTHISCDSICICDGMDCINE